ncbi:hypothetical protein VP01_2361g4 [Puccinia sorghi]|uniref:Uncharacterized protein n=1 Tax=Puccinia sorghi TaxID=27349 RepID=A0A0L6V741_9BASI|nr:hypothetical protein VP01_2361g4 [Puccinia sorghi]
MAALGIELFQCNPVAQTHTSNNNINPQIMEDQNNVFSNNYLFYKLPIILFQKKVEKIGMKAVNSRKSFKYFKPRSTSFSDFHQMVAAKCNRSPPIEWSVYLLWSPSLPEFNKSANYLLSDVASFNRCGKKNRLNW